MMLMPTVDSSIMFIKKRRSMEVIPPRWMNLWREWQLRVLVLSSLTTQIILVFLGKRRKHVSGSWIRFTVWLAYLLADSIALMAAGIISNEVGGVYDANGLVDPKHELITFWAPILLLHLGGTDSITAYSLDDSELWKRHLLGVVVQAISTLYIWLTAWTSSTLSLLSFVMFIVGLLKYGERVLGLFLASEDTFRDSIPDIPIDNSKIREKCKLKQLEGYHLATHRVLESSTTSIESLHPDDAHELLMANSLLEMVKRLFADFIMSSQDRDVSRGIFQRLSRRRAIKIIEIELGFIYDLLYTKANAIYSRLGITLRIIAIFIISIVLVLFLNLKEKRHHSKGLRLLQSLQQSQVTTPNQAGEAPDRQVAEVQQVEQTSSDETNSIEEMEMKTDEIKQVEQNREANPVKGNELRTKRGTKPPLNFRAILTDKKIPMDRFDKSSPDELCKKLYAGVFLEPNALKYYVDEKLNKNCFVVFAKKLSISWIDQYWGWIEEKDTSGVIEVAKLKELGVCWLNIEGKIRTIDLSPGTEYEVVFVVKMNEHYRYTWKKSVTLTIILPSSKPLTCSENLSGKPAGIWIDVKVGEFRMTPENVGEITFKLGEYSPEWKKGLVLKCAIIRPKNDQALGYMKRMKTKMKRIRTRMKMTMMIMPVVVVHLAHMMILISNIFMTNEACIVIK